MAVPRRLRKDPWSWGAVLDLAAGGAVLGLDAALPRSIGTAELKLLDQRFRAYAGTRRPSPDAVLVAVGQKT